MTKARSHETLFEQVAEFERQNPKLTQAMKLFGMTMTEYQYALNTMYAPRIVTGNSSVKIDSRNNGKLARYR